MAFRLGGRRFESLGELLREASARGRAARLAAQEELLQHLAVDGKGPEPDLKAAALLSGGLTAAVCLTLVLTLPWYSPALLAVLLTAAGFAPAFLAPLRPRSLLLAVALPLVPVALIGAAWIGASGPGDVAFASGLFRALAWGWVGCVVGAAVGHALQGGASRASGR